MKKMKNYLAIFILTWAFVHNLSAQVKRPIELYDLVLLFAPDSSTGSPLVDWKRGAEAASPVKWSSTLKKTGKETFTKEGNVKVLINKKVVSCGGGGGEGVCEWYIILDGPGKGYRIFTIGADNFHIDKDENVLNTLFRKNRMIVTLLKRDTESILFWNYRYKVHLPGKLPLWMKIEYENQTATAGQAEASDFTDLFSITFYTDEKDLNKLQPDY